MINVCYVVICKGENENYWTIFFSKFKRMIETSPYVFSINKGTSIVRYVFNTYKIPIGSSEKATFSPSHNVDEKLVLRISFLSWHWIKISTPSGFAWAQCFHKSDDPAHNVGDYYFLHHLFIVRLVSCWLLLLCCPSHCYCFHCGWQT